MKIDGETLVWKVDAQGNSIRWTSCAWKALAAACQSGFRDSPWGGVEIGGILLGSHVDGNLLVEEFYLIDCGHSLGPSYELTKAEQADFGTSLAQTGSKQTIGWFHTVSHRSADLSAADIDLAGEFFPQPWQISLLLRRFPDREPEPTLFTWQDGSLIPLDLADGIVPAEEPKPAIDLYRSTDLLEPVSPQTTSSKSLLETEADEQTDEDLPQRPIETNICGIELFQLLWTSLFSRPEEQPPFRRYRLRLWYSQPPQTLIPVAKFNSDQAVPSRAKSFSGD